MDNLIDDLASKAVNSPEQITAIRSAISLGKQLQLEIPQIADDYRDGLYTSKIARKYNLPLMYGVNEKVAISAIGYAIRGNNGIYNTEPYQGFIKDSDELEILYKQHLTKNGLETYEQGLGIYALTPEQRIEYNKQAGLKGGAKAYQQGKGIYALTPEQKREYGRKGVISRGQTPWAEESIDEKVSEIERAYNLFQLPEYTISLIAKKLNEEYHNNTRVRTRKSVEGALRKYRKKVIPQNTLS